MTGGGGFLGRYIVEQLLERGDRVRVFARGDYPELRDLGVEVLRGDLKDFNSLKQACRGVDVVFHTAAKVGLWGKYQDFYNTNVIGTENVINACLANEVERLIYTSTPSVVFAGEDLCDVDESVPYAKRFLSNYPATKVIAEQRVLEANKNSGFATAALRPHLMWGPRDTHIVPTIVQRARSGKLFKVGDGNNIVDFTYIENAARAHLLAADNLSENSVVAGNSYFISQNEPVVLWDFIERLLGAFDLPAPQRSISLGGARCIGALMEFFYRFLPLPGEPRMTRFLAAQLAKSHYFDCSKAERDFGYRAEISIEQGLKRLCASA